MTHKRIFVSGSVHLDLIATVTSHADTVDKIGELVIETGGTAYNVAMGLARRGKVSVVFHSLLREAPLSRFLTAELEKNNVKLAIEYNRNLPHSGFSAHVLNGEMIAAVSSMAVERFHVRDTPVLRQALSGCSWVVLDCNHQTTSLTTMINAARNIGATIAVCGVSEGKALKIAKIPPVDYIFLNDREYAYLQKKTSPWFLPENCIAIITMRADGVRAEDSKGEIFRLPTMTEDSPTPGNYLGAGDALCSGTIDALCAGYTLSEALQAGSLAARQVIGSINCNPGESNLLARHLDELNARQGTDFLTGLAARREGMEQLARRIAEANALATPLSIVFSDIDHFKKINDNFSHAVGDQALIHAAKTLSRVMRRDVDVAARWGGEEFVLILPGCPLSGAVTIAERIRKELASSPLTVIGKSITMSFGAAQYVAGETVDSFIAGADEAMYRAKQAGRNQVVARESGLNQTATYVANL